MRFKWPGLIGAFAALVVLFAAHPVAAQDREPPYWASISAGRAHMRAGPGRTFPIEWVYQRAGLPVRVVEIYENWRKIEDPEGISGWMLVNLLSSERTAMVTGGTRPLREEPSRSAPVRYEAEAGVVGRLRDCREGWCDFDVDGRRGYIETGHLHGVGGNERVD